MSDCPSRNIGNACTFPLGPNISAAFYIFKVLPLLQDLSWMLRFPYIPPATFWLILIAPVSNFWHSLTLISCHFTWTYFCYCFLIECMVGVGEAEGLERRERQEFYELVADVMMLMAKGRISLYLPFQSFSLKAEKMTMTVSQRMVISQRVVIVSSFHSGAFKISISYHGHWQNVSMGEHFSCLKCTFLPISCIKNFFQLGQSCKC